MVVDFLGRLSLLMLPLVMNVWEKLTFVFVFLHILYILFTVGANWKS